MLLQQGIGAGVATGVAALGAGAGFILPLGDLGAGAVDLSLPRGSGAATFARATTATTFDVTGAAPVLVGSGVARSYYDPASHVYLGYLPEEARTNLLLNSTIDGANLSTQSVTTSAAQYALSFYGTGTITLSGTATGAKVGTGAYPARSTFVFTPTAGTLTLTVTGTVQYAQLEATSTSVPWSTSFIPTAGASVTRNQDILTFAQSGNLDNTAGAIYAEAMLSVASGGNLPPIVCDRGVGGGLFHHNIDSTKTDGYDGTNQAVTAAGPDALLGPVKMATSWSGAAMKAVRAGGAVASGTFDGNLGVASIGIGVGNTVTTLCSSIKNVRIWRRALSDAELVALTS